MSIRSQMLDTVDVVTETQQKSGTGMSTVKTYVTSASALPCRVFDLTPDDALVIYGRYDVNAQKTVYFPADPGLTVKDFIVWQGSQYRVHSTQDMGGNIHRLWKVQVEQKGA